MISKGISSGITPKIPAVNPMTNAEGKPAHNKGIESNIPSIKPTKTTPLMVPRNPKIALLI